jgi:hypothetical protein
MEHPTTPMDWVQANKNANALSIPVDEGYGITYRRNEGKTEAVSKKGVL